MNTTINDKIEYLVEKAKAGDTKSFDKLTQELTPVYEYYESKFFAQGEEKDDFRLVCLTATWDSLNNYKIGQGNVKQYISKCICFRLYDFITKANILRFRHLNDALPNEIFDENNILVEVDRIDESSLNHTKEYNTTDILINAIKPHLTEIEYQIMFLRLKWDYNYEEIGEITGLKAKKVDNIYTRATKRLKLPEIKEEIDLYLLDHHYFDFIEKEHN